MWRNQTFFRKLLDNLAGDTAEMLVKRADELMYRSKRAGRNCVSCDPPAEGDRSHE